MGMNRWLDLVSLMLTSAEVVFSKVSEKGTGFIQEMIYVARCKLLDTVEAGNWKVERNKKETGNQLFTCFVSNCTQLKLLFAVCFRS